MIGWQIVLMCYMHWNQQPSDGEGAREVEYPPEFDAACWAHVRAMRDIIEKDRYIDLFLPDDFDTWCLESWWDDDD